MGFISILGCAQKLVSERVQPGEPVIDATVGNGVDTLFLSKLTGCKGEVYGFDVQQIALEKAARRWQQDPGKKAGVHWLNCSHAEMKSIVSPHHHGHIAAIMFNLGYLPGADPGTITLPASTLAALQSSVELLRIGGILTVVLYTGHPGGQEEADAVEEWAAKLNPKSFQVIKYERVNQSKRPPYLIAVEKVAPCD
ncbi:class I SAM-dependent methyltransferase [Paenibacillus senegalensis]|uniref:class I SAM-dependent methyltransferase n=1 Tax=Paenibacillus senegalensis TaxID=1465766 RepID=UPI00028982FD|nr:class I SAM-dependent methyltransferase [Paenibacillus senegalensis]